MKLGKEANSNGGGADEDRGSQQQGVIQWRRSEGAAIFDEVERCGGLVLSNNRGKEDEPDCVDQATSTRL